MTHTGLSPATARLSRRFCFDLHCHWPGPRSLATTNGVSVDVLSCGYLDVSVPRVRFLTLWIQVKIPFIDTWKPFRLSAQTTCTVLFRSRPYRPSKMAWPARARRISGDGRSALRSSARFELFSLASLPWKKNTVQSTASATARRPRRVYPPVLAAPAEDRAEGPLIRERKQIIPTGMIFQVSKVGCPIRIFTDQSLFAAPRNFSQRITSFIACACQGIHQMPF